MTHRSTAHLLAFLFSAALVFAQASPPTRKPSPELEKQSFFIGTWKLEGTTKSSPYTHGGDKFESTEHLEWMPGGFFLLAHSYSDGKLAEVTVIGYDPKDKSFTHTSFTSSGETELWRGTAENDTWIWTKEQTVNGKALTERLTVKKTSPNSYSFAQDIKIAGGDWVTVAQGTGTRTKQS